ncbi:hypothetical protein M409DRAFT_51764 [Zasmidium cellare ATCC 36951]|uniref:Uncharacterized protein n=1 Tax=Zasmidium cellare ATCC 36951 TaxID=1080233 RepID=A0A6A6CS50_ZASCE|nr:uncharacterized protein M409DRAFT_51764 [Zasmidium cellare ATCC 36951]KAF2169984.1 hypothetical protein M409DRAFT_51764 [Zasmidium cellare ATCC 36951]
MCYKETPYHKCGHYGKARFVGGEPCIRATSQSGLSQGCWDVVDYGITSVNTLCSQCKASFCCVSSSTCSPHSLSSASSCSSSSSSSSSAASTRASSITTDFRGRSMSNMTDFISAASSRSTSRASSANSSPSRPPPSMYGTLPKTKTGGTLKSVAEL